MAGERPKVAAAWDLDVEAGDPVTIFARPYVFERVDPDGAVTFRAPAGLAHGDFLVIDGAGHRRKPTVEEVLALSDEELVWHEKPLASQARRFARERQLDAQQAHAMDELSEFRSAITRRYDDAPWSKSDQSLRAFMKEALADPVIAAMPGAWAACPATQRTWFNERGTEGCRKERDGVSMRNRTRTIRKLKHPLEILFHHAAAATNLRGSVRQNHDRYVAEIADINAGRPLDRRRFDFETGRMTEEEASYPIPNDPWVAVDYMRFWRLCRELRGEGAYGRKTTKQGAYQRYGGGGLGDLPTHLGARCWIDSSPVKKAFFVDGVTGIPIGQATFTLMLEHQSKVAPGWDLCPGACNSSSILRTVLRANQVKHDIPEHLLAVDPNLPYLRLRSDMIGFDNSLEAHGRSVEQNLADAYIGTDFVGSEMPRDKNAMERVMGTFQELLYNHVEDANYDIARMRLYGFDPEEHVLCSIQEGRRLFALAVMTYNVTRHRGLDHRQPALVWKQLLGTRKLKIIRDVDQFRDSIGVVDKATMTSAGLAKFNRRYTAGAVDMRRICEDFERARRAPTGDIAPKPDLNRNRDDRKHASYEVRIRYDEDDIGVVKVWNPYAASGATWERFGCTDPNAHGMPLWLHQRCLELAEREAMDYLTPEGQAVVRARLFEEIANVDSQAAERQRQTLGRALADPRVKQVMRGYVEVADEKAIEPGEVPPEEHEPVGHALSIGKRVEEDIETPRSRAKASRPPAAMRRRNQGARTRSDATPGQADQKPASEAQDARSAAPPRRRRQNASKNDAGRDTSTAPNQSADRPDKRARSRTRSNRMKWGDSI